MRVHVDVRRLVLARPFVIARGAVAYEDVVEVSLEHDGILGRGEGTPIRYLGERASDGAKALRAVAERAVGSDCFDLEGLRARCHELAIPRGAAAALDGAAHDWVGHALGRPTWQCLGLSRAARPTSYTISIGDEVDTRRQLRAAERFPVVKVKLGAPDDLARVRLVRRCTAATIRVDANGGWTLEDARRLLPELHALGVELVEQPFRRGDIESLVRLRDERPPVPIFADESCLDTSELPGVVGLVDGVVVKISKAGGIRESLRLIHAAQALGLRVLLGCMLGSQLGISAASQLVSISDLVDLDAHLLLGAQPYTGLENGPEVMPPGRAGLGVAPSRTGA